MSGDEVRERVAGSGRRVVLDTNVVLSTLLFSAGHLALLRAAWQRREFVPLVNTQTVHELMRALGYPKFRLPAKEREELLADYLPYVEVVLPGQTPQPLPACRDPSDRMFLALAAIGRADALVTGERDLLTLHGQVEFPIMSADSFLRSLGYART